MTSLIRDIASDELSHTPAQERYQFPRMGLEVIQEGIPLDQIGAVASGADPQCDGKCGCRDVCNCT